MSEKKVRNSNIEIVRILAIFLIIVSHSVPFWNIEMVGNTVGFFNIENATNNYKEFILICFRYLGQIGDCIFIICSAWFLLENDKINIKKVINIALDTFAISIVFLGIFLLIGIKLSTNSIIKCILPLTFENNWFIKCYLLFYIMHPALNKIINSLKQEDLLKVNIFLIVYFYFWNSIKMSTHTFVNLFGFIVLYFLIAYMKKYMLNFRKDKKKNISILFMSIGILIGLLIFIDIIGLKVSMFDGKMQKLSNTINPLVVLISITIFNLFNTKNFVNNKVNYISSLTLLIYLIHDNILLRNYLKSFYFKNIYLWTQYNHIILVVIFTSIIVFIISILCSILYKLTVQKVVKRISDCIYNIGNKIVDKIKKCYILDDK